MVKSVVNIEGMSCGMCEAHISDTIRKVYPKAKKISASHTKNVATFITDDAVDYAPLKKAIDDTGYHYISAEGEPYEKKKRGLFGRK